MTENDFEAMNDAELVGVIAAMRDEARSLSERRRAARDVYVARDRGAYAALITDVAAGRKCYSCYAETGSDTGSHTQCPGCAEVAA